MKIEYEQPRAGIWVATLSGQKIGVIMMQRNYPGEEPEHLAHATDATVEVPVPIPGSPFETVNHAKAALEYHFRHLIAAE